MERRISPLLSLIAFLTLSVSILYGEVERITIRWNSAICDEKCAHLIEKELKKIEGQEQVTVNASSGVATVKWKPDVQFSFMPINVAMRMVGANIDDIRIRVRGVVKEEGKDLALYSLEDNTRFRIVSPMRSELHRQTMFPNPSLMEIDPQLRDTILRDAEQDKIIVIEGPLYKPTQSPPLVIVIERILVEKKKATTPLRK